VPVTDTVRGFKEILDGKHDEVAEGNFYMKGGIDEIQETPGESKSKEVTAKVEKPASGAKAGSQEPKKEVASK